MDRALDMNVLASGDRNPDRLVQCALAVLVDPRVAVVLRTIRMRTTLTAWELVDWVEFLAEVLEGLKILRFCRRGTLLFGVQVSSFPTPSGASTEEY